MIRFRVHLIITADELIRPLSFRTDVILSSDDVERAYELAENVAKDQDPLTAMRVIGRSAEVLAL